MEIYNLRKKILFFSFLIIFILGIFGSNIAWAKLNAPSVLQVVAVGEGSAKLSWNWASGGGTINRFVLSFRVAGTAEEWKKRYPSAEVREYTLMGLTANTTYEWTLMAEAGNPANNSSETTGINFTTQTSVINGNGNGWNPGVPYDMENPLHAKTLEEALENLIKFLFFLIMALAPVFIIYAAFLILTSGGDSAKVTQAKRIILWAAIAVAVAVTARIIVGIVKGLLGG